MRPEDRLRARCKMYLDRALPSPGSYTAIEHGISYSGTKLQRAMRWGRLKAQGVKAGVEDLQILYLSRIMAVELKVGSNTQQPAQVTRQREVEANGGYYVVLRSVSGLHNWLVDVMGVPVLPSMKILALDYDAKLATPVKKSRKSRSTDVEKPTAAKIRKVGRIRKQVMF